MIVPEKMEQLLFEVPNYKQVIEKSLKFNWLYKMGWVGKIVCQTTQGNKISNEKQ